MSLRLLALDALDPRIVAAQCLERAADETAGMLDDLTDREARLRHEARLLRAAVEESRELEEIQREADRIVPMQRNKTS